MALSRRPARSRPIRLFLIGMFAVPLLSLVALYAFAASTTIANAVTDQQYNRGVKIVTEGFGGLTQGLPQEQAATYVAEHRPVRPERVHAGRAQDRGRGIRERQERADAGAGPGGPHARAAQDALFAALGQLGKTRAAVDAGTISPLAAFAVYSNLVDAPWRFYFSSNSKDASFTDVSIGATNLSYAIPMGAREATLVGGALASGGQMSAAARQVFTATVAVRRSLMNEGIAGLTPDLGAPYTALENSPQYQQFQGMEDQIIASPAARPVPVRPAAWQQASGAYLAGMGKAELDSGTKLGAMSNSLANRLVLEAILAGGNLIAEVEDRGLGLAARHDIQITLRRSVYGGTTAVVLLPFGVILREDEAPPVRSDQGEWISASGRALTRTPGTASGPRPPPPPPDPPPGRPCPRLPRSRHGRSGRRPRCRPARGPCRPAPVGHGGDGFLAGDNPGRQRTA